MWWWLPTGLLWREKAALVALLRGKPQYVLMERFSSLRGGGGGIDRSYWGRKLSNACVMACTLSMLRQMIRRSSLSPPQGGRRFDGIRLAELARWGRCARRSPEPGAFDAPSDALPYVVRPVS